MRADCLCIFAVAVDDEVADPFFNGDRQDSSRLDVRAHWRCAFAVIISDVVTGPFFIAWVGDSMIRVVIFLLKEILFLVLGTGVHCSNLTAGNGDNLLVLTSKLPNGFHFLLCRSYAWEGALSGLPYFVDVANADPSSVVCILKTPFCVGRGMMPMCLGLDVLIVTIFVAG